MKFYVYILKSIKTSRFYIGQTQDISNRLSRHNSGYEKSTKAFIPWKLVYSRSFSSRTEAYKFEQKLKSYKKRSQIEKLFQK